MSFLYPSMFMEQEDDPARHEGVDIFRGPDITPGTPMGDVFSEVLDTRRQKFLDVIGKIIEIGYDEERLPLFLNQGLKALDGQSIVEYLMKHEEDDACEPVMEALDRFSTGSGY